MTVGQALVLDDALAVGDADLRAAIEALGGLTTPFDAQDVNSVADRLDRLRSSIGWLRESVEGVA